MVQEFFRWISSGPDSQDNINFKIKPFNSIFDPEIESEEEKQVKIKFKRGYPPPTFPLGKGNKHGM